MCAMKIGTSVSAGSDRDPAEVLVSKQRHGPIGQPHKALLIIDRAIQSHQGHKFVYVVDAQNKVQRRDIITRSLQADGLRAVEGEIKPDDWVVVGRDPAGP